MHPEAKRAISGNNRLNDFKATVEAAKARGLIHAPGDKVPVKVNGAGAAGTTIETSIEGMTVRVRFEFLAITPEQARAWLVGNNAGNRELRETTRDAYARDMRNGDWRLNHQGIAFNDADELIDGQHRLAGIVESGLTVTMLVSHGWPRATTQRTKLMDTVDRGAARSIADVLGLQHGIESPRIVLMTAVALAMALIDHPKATAKMTAPAVLTILEAFRDGIRFTAANRPKTKGLRQAPVLAAVALSFGPWPKETPAFLAALVSGAGLDADNPILPLRNWLLSDAVLGRALNRSAQVALTARVLEHFRLWRTKGRAATLQDGRAGIEEIIERQPSAVAKVRVIFARKEAV